MSAALAALFALLSPATATAEPREIAARVVWAHADRAYLAAPDSGALEFGLIVTLRDRRHDVASGEITQVMDARLAAIRVTAGSLSRVKKLDRLRVFAERPAPRPVPLLRAGFPAGARANLAVSCGEMTLALPLPAGEFRADTLGTDGFRFVRIARWSAGPPWPDTLIARLFAESADEEIALERGEIDVAVFWPGEPSAHARDDARGRDAPLAPRSRGILAAIESANGAPLPKTWAHADRNYAALNERLFGGDLMPWSDGGAPADTASGYAWTASGPAPGPGEYTVDASLPGRVAIARFLNRGERVRAPDGPFASGLTYLDQPPAARDSLATAWRARGITPLYTLRCPVLCASGWRDYVRALGLAAFADAMVCSLKGARP